jgi:hypothetical protein
MTTDALTLSAFLLARIEEDEAVASKQRIHDISTCPVVWHRRLGHVDHEWADCECGISSKIEDECEAKRAIVQLHHSPMTDLAAALEDQGAKEWESVSGDAGLTRDQFREHQRTLRVLAAVYADHPDYRAEWAL